MLPNSHPIPFFFFFNWVIFCCFSRHWMVSFSRWLRTQSTSGCWIHLCKTFSKVFTGVFKTCVWVLHMRPMNFTFHSFSLTKKKDLALFKTFSAQPENSTKTASATTNHNLMSLWGTHTDFYFLFFMCIKLLDGDEGPSQPWSGEHDGPALVLLSICF